MLIYLLPQNGHGLRSLMLTPSFLYLRTSDTRLRVVASEHLSGSSLAQSICADLLLSVPDSHYGYTLHRNRNMHLCLPKYIRNHDTIRIGSYHRCCTFFSLFLLNISAAAPFLNGDSTPATIGLCSNSSKYGAGFVSAVPSFLPFVCQ